MGFRWSTSVAKYNVYRKADVSVSLKCWNFISTQAGLLSISCFPHLIFTFSLKSLSRRNHLSPVFGGWASSVVIFTNLSRPVVRNDISYHSFLLSEGMNCTGNVFQQICTPCSFALSGWFAHEVQFSMGSYSLGIPTHSRKCLIWYTNFLN